MVLISTTDATYFADAADVTGPDRSFAIRCMSLGHASGALQNQSTCFERFYSDLRFVPVVPRTEKSPQFFSEGKLTYTEFCAKMKMVNVLQQFVNAPLIDTSNRLPGHGVRFTVKFLLPNMYICQTYTL
jgi:hypothetical protein